MPTSYHFCAFLQLRHVVKCHPQKGIEMKAKPDCIVCMFRQALNTLRLITDDPEVHRKVLSKIARWISDTSLYDTPAGISQPVYDIIAEATGVWDPYEKQKKESNEIALILLPALKSIVDTAEDPLDAALHIAAAGNTIDLGIDHKFNIEKDVPEIMNLDFAISAIEEFRKELGPRKKFLYLGDNAGEIVFDMLLVEHILQTRTEVIFAVKSGPIINDATMKDAEEIGMTNLVRVIETGSNDIGVNWNNASREFRKFFQDVDVIIGKGHGNFETCNDRPENIYFLLKAKCQMVADELGARLGDIVFKHSTN